MANVGNKLKLWQSLCIEVRRLACLPLTDLAWCCSTSFPITGGRQQIRVLFPLRHPYAVTKRHPDRVLSLFDTHRPSTRCSIVPATV
jgi:hypothetical protein